MIKSVDLSLPKEDWFGFELERCPYLKDSVEVRPFQEYAVYHALTRDRSVNGLQTGLGKTLCAFLAFYYYKTVFPNTRLIFATTNSAILQVHSEMYKFFKVSESVATIHRGMGESSRDTYAAHRAKVLKSFIAGDIDVVITNYTILRREYKFFFQAAIEMRGRGEHLFLVLDEATIFKGRRTQVSERVKSLCNLSNKVIAMTATLIKGRLEHAFEICSNLGIPLAQSKADFERKFCVMWIPKSKKKWFLKKRLGYKNIEMFLHILKDVAVILKKSDVAECLPPFIPQIMTLEHDTVQLRALKQLFEDPIEFDAEDPNVSPFLVDESETPRETPYVVQVGYSKMGLLDPRLIPGTEAPEDYVSPKTKRILELLSSDVDGKVLIYTHSLQYLNLLRDAISKCEDLDQGYRNVLCISGDVSAEEREHVKDIFTRSEDYNLILLNDAGIEAINLQAAKTLIVTTLPRSSGDLVQLAGRLSRIGSEHECLHLIYLLTENSQDMDEYEITQRQLYLMSLIMGEAEKGLLDMDLLQKMDSVDDPEEYRNKSLMYFVLKGRSKREKQYLSWVEGKNAKF